MSILQELAHIDKQRAQNILIQAAAVMTPVQIKNSNSPKIVNSHLKPGTTRKYFYLADKADFFDAKEEVTVKIIVGQHLYFLKTHLKKSDGALYFENYEHLYELVRRKKPRFQIPEHWPQSAIIQSTHYENELRSPCSVLEISKAGMKLNVRAELPRYEKNQVVKLQFKVFRRAAVFLKAKIIHVKKNKSGGPTVGVQFLDETALAQDKVQNICDDLAFYYCSAEDVT